MEDICYNVRGDYMTNNKVIKGKNVYEGWKINIDKEIEVRVHLAEKMRRVAKYPNYENVVELSNKDLIENNTQYRFAIEMYFKIQKMILTYFSIVDKFDDKM